MNPYFPIYNPKTAPVRGMRSAVSPASLDPGIMAQLTNWRFTENDLTKRWGVQLLNNAGVPMTVPVAGASYRGCWSGTIAGSNVVLVAFRVGAETRVYDFNTSTLAWTEITTGAAASKYGNTRFTTDGAVCFTAVTSPNYPEAVIIGCASGENPRVYTRSTGFVAQIQANPYDPLPSDYLASGRTSVEMGFTDSVVFNTAAGRGGGAYANSTANLAAADAGLAAPNSYTTLTVTPGVAAGDTATLNFLVWVGGAMVQGIGKQLILILGGGWDTLLDDVEIGVENSGASYTRLYTPGEDFNIAVIPGVDSSDDSKYILGISLAGYTGLDIAKLRFTWRGAAAPAANKVAMIYFAATGGVVPGGCSYGYTWDNPETQWETPGRIIGNIVTNDAVNSYETASANLGGSGSALFGVDNQALKLVKSSIYVSSIPFLGGTNIPTLSFPNSPLIFFNPVVRFPLVSNIATYKHSHCNLYRSDPGEEDYFLVQQYTAFTYVFPSWVATGGTTVTLTDTTDPANKDFGRVMPDSAVQWVPPHASSHAVGGRLYVGTTPSTTLFGASVFAASDAGYPCRFRVATKFIDPSTADPSSGTSVSFPGEYVTGITAMPSALLGVSPALVFTNRSVYRFDGIDAAALSRPAYLGPHGTRSPSSIAEHNGTVYYLDSELQIRSIAGYQTKALSDRKVENKTKAAATVYAHGACYNNRYYMFFGPNGSTTYSNSLVYEEDMFEFCEDNYGSLNFRGSFAVETQAGRIVFLITDAGLIYELERPGQTTDNGVTINGTITTPFYHSDMWSWKVYGRVGVVSDKTAATATIARTFKPEASGQSGTINLNLGTTSAYRWEFVAGEIAPGGSGIACQITLTDTIPGGSRLYSIVTEVQDTGTARAETG